MKDIVLKYIFTSGRRGLSCVGGRGGQEGVQVVGQGGRWGKGGEGNMEGSKNKGRKRT